MTIPYLDSSVETSVRVSDLLQRMTLEEKAGLFFHPYSWLPSETLSSSAAIDAARVLIEDKNISHFVVMNGTSASEIARWTNALQEIAASTRLRVPLTFSSDPRSGFKSSAFTGQTLDSLSRWPEHLGLAALGDLSVVRDYADTIRREFLAMGVRVYLGPMADLFTEPRWSRGYGTFGEDPDAVALFTAEFIKGLRGQAVVGHESVSAIVKHFPGAGPQEAGRDAIDVRFPDQVYPGGLKDVHVRPFISAINAGVTQMMLYYGRPVGTDWDTRGFAFNKDVVDGLLRNELGFDGIVTTDWNAVGSEPFNGHPFGPIAHGVDGTTVDERLVLALEAGVDQFGGDTLSAELAQLVRDGRVEESRIDASARRILTEKFRLGLFESGPVDPHEAERVARDPRSRSRGRAAQAASLTLLKIHDPELLPLAAGTRLYARGFDGDSANSPFVFVDRPADADFCVVRIDSPWEPDPESSVPDLHGGSLEFAPELIESLRALASVAPLILDVYLERPAILAPLLDVASILVVDYGASDEVVLNALAGHTEFGGRLPFDIPRDMASVEASREDVPFDTVRPTFRAGDGLQLPAGMKLVGAGE